MALISRHASDEPVTITVPDWVQAVVLEYFPDPQPKTHPKMQKNVRTKRFHLAQLIVKYLPKDSQ